MGTGIPEARPKHRLGTFSQPLLFEKDSENERSYFKKCTFQDRLLTCLEKIHPAVVAMDEQLKPNFGGESAAALVKNALKDLDAAQAAQEVSVASMPRETLEIYETKGRLLAKIEA